MKGCPWYRYRREDDKYKITDNIEIADLIEGHRLLTILTITPDCSPYELDIKEICRSHP
jgi:hypothetical protein